MCRHKYREGNSKEAIHVQFKHHLKGLQTSKHLQRRHHSYPRVTPFPRNLFSLHYYPSEVSTGKLLIMYIPCRKSVESSLPCPSACHSQHRTAPQTTTRPDTCNSLVPAIGTALGDVASKHRTNDALIGQPTKQAPMVPVNELQITVTCLCMKWFQGFLSHWTCTLHSTMWSQN